MSLKWSPVTDQLYAVSNSSPSLDLDFASNKSLLDNISGLPLVNHQRDASSGKSAGTYVGSDGLIKTSVVNLLPYSDYSQTASTTDAQLEGVVAAPDGTITARRYSVPSAGLDAINKVYSAGTVGKDYTFSVWVRSTGTASEVRIIVGDSAVNAIVQISTQWQRFEITKINNASNLVRSYVQLLNVGDEVEVFGAQLEEGTTASDYIPTGATISGAPRFDHDPVTGESLGLLIEESRTNLLQYSEEFNQSIWAKSNTGIVTPNIGTSPDGSLTADRINLGTGFTWVVQSKSFSSGDATFSVYLKSNTGSDQTARLRIFDGTGSNFSPDLTVTSGWQRFSFTRTNLAGGGNVMITKYDAETLDVLAWGAQLEQNASFPTSYIPTTGSAVTRSPDIASIEGTNFSSWFTQNTGTVFVEASLQSPAASGQSPIVSIDNSGADFRAIARRASAGVRNTSNADLIDVTGAIWDGEKKKIAATWVPNDCALVDDGVLVGTDTSTNSPLATVNQMQIGQVNSGGFLARMGGHIARLAYYPYRLADATLQEITS